MKENAFSVLYLQDTSSLNALDPGNHASRSYLGRGVNRCEERRYNTGMRDYFLAAASLSEAGETSMVLSWPVWPAVAAMVPSFILLAAAALYNAAVHWGAASHREQQA